MTKQSPQEWLLLFYSVPSLPVSNRMKLWRKLAKMGAAQLKGSVYILPATDELEEFLQWLIGEVKSMGGDGAFVRTPEIKTMAAADIYKLFASQIEKEYREFSKSLDTLERKVESIRKGSTRDDQTPLVDQTAKHAKEYGEIHSRDFFSSAVGRDTAKRLLSIQSALIGLAKTDRKPAMAIGQKSRGKYQGRTWLTRKNPFIDRMASAWLIKRFIDKNAAFGFIDERQQTALKKNDIAFDMQDAEFTHVGDLCTFEVLVRSFNIKDKAVRKIAELVHDLDVKDDKYKNAEAAGIEDILTGIRKTAKNDADALERGMAVFEMMYQSRS
jgi:hypothetical protein